MLRYIPIFALAAFVTIQIDEPTYEKIIAAAHQTMRGPEDDWFVSMMQALERREIDKKAADDKDQGTASAPK